jgi:hypothetical protein
MFIENLDKISIDKIKNIYIASNYDFHQSLNTILKIIE